MKNIHSWIATTFLCFGILVMGISVTSAGTLQIDFLMSGFDDHDGPNSGPTFANIESGPLLSFPNDTVSATFSFDSYQLLKDRSFESNPHIFYLANGLRMGFANGFVSSVQNGQIGIHAFRSQSDGMLYNIISMSFHSDFIPFEVPDTPYTVTGLNLHVARIDANQTVDSSDLDLISHLMEIETFDVSMIALIFIGSPSGGGIDEVSLVQSGIPELGDPVVRPVPPSAVPLPAALPLFGTGLGIMGFIGWRRKRMKATPVINNGEG